MPGLCCGDKAAVILCAIGSLDRLRGAQPDRERWLCRPGPASSACSSCRADGPEGAGADEAVTEAELLAVVMV